MRTLPLLAALAGAIVLAPAAGAETDLAAWPAQDTATGDWGGLRSRAKAAPGSRSTATIRPTS